MYNSTCDDASGNVQRGMCYRKRQSGSTWTAVSEHTHSRVIVSSDIRGARVPTNSWKLGDATPKLFPPHKLFIRAWYTK